MVNTYNVLLNTGHGIVLEHCLYIFKRFISCHFHYRYINPSPEFTKEKVNLNNRQYIETKVSRSQ